MCTRHARCILVFLIVAGLILLPRTAVAQYRTCGTRSTEACVAPGSLRFTAISTGPTHTCALDTRGTAWCWGDGRQGALGDDTLHIQRWPQQVATSQRFAAIAAGGNFTCARTTDGVVYCWGGERTVPGWPNVAAVPIRVTTNVLATALTAGRRHACILDAEQRAHCWGFNVDGETGTGTAGIDAAMVAAPTPVVGDRRFQSLSAGTGFTCGVSIDGAVFCWGSNIDGVMGDAAQERCGEVASVRCSTKPVEIAASHRWSIVAAGTKHVCGVSDGSVYCWGTNDAGQVGPYTERRPLITSPQRVDLPNRRVASLQSGGIHSCAVTEQRELFCWGADAWTFSDPRYYADELLPRQPIKGARISAVSAGQVHSCALEVSGRARCWGDTILGAFGVR